MKVLVADDELGLRNLISAVLQEAGHEVVTANDSRRTVQMLSSERPDLLILDMMMPGWTGQQLVNHMDGELGLNNLPLILMRPGGHLDWLPEGHSPAVTLPKPFDLQGLLSSVEAVSL
ncbi:MAG TPA: response regulator [Chloroflexota bacterium]|nr:response regulator [Chloroflexota bacterium]